MRFLNKLDRYILNKFFITLIFTLFFLMLIVLVIDLNGQQNRLSMNNKSTIDYLKDYALYFCVYLSSKFIQIVAFIAVIFFTSTLSNNTEIVAMHSGGMSFYRFSRPYFIGGILVALLMLGVGHYFLPMSNVKRNDFKTNSLAGYSEKMMRSQLKEIHQFISPKEQLNLLDYNQLNKTGRGFSYFKYNDSLRRIYSLSAENASWNDKKKCYVLSNVYEKFGEINYDKKEYKNKISRYDDKIAFYPNKELKIDADPEYLLPEENVAEDLTTPNLLKFIERKKMQGDTNINRYLTELYERSSIPISVLVLIILGMIIASKKKRGGIGLNLAIGIGLAFLYVFFFYTLSSFSKNNEINPILGVSIPNIIFITITLILYFRRVRI